MTTICWFRRVLRLDDHPALARLRLVQAATPGSQLVLDVSDRSGDTASR